MLPEIEPIPEIGPAERVFARPSWADPSFMVHANEFAFDTFETGTAVVQQIVNNNPRRWGLIFIIVGPPAATVFLAPINRPASFGWTLDATTFYLRFNIFDYGPLVTNEWYSFSTAPVTVGVYEIEVSQ